MSQTAASLDVGADGSHSTSGMTTVGSALQTDNLQLVRETAARGDLVTAVLSPVVT